MRVGTPHDWLCQGCNGLNGVITNSVGFECKLLACRHCKRKRKATPEEQQLCADNINMAHKIGRDNDDFKSVAMEGLLLAAMYYCDTRCKFSTVAYTFMKTAVVTFLKESKLAAARATKAHDHMRVFKVEQKNYPEIQDITDSILDSLPDDHSNLLRAYYLLGEGQSTIGTRTGMTRKQVSQKLNRIIKTIKV